jgi:hypothetical protein
LIGLQEIIVIGKTHGDLLAFRNEVYLLSLSDGNFYTNRMGKYNEERFIDF